jgi:hypothetical protein
MIWVNLKELLEPVIVHRVQDVLKNNLSRQPDHPLGSSHGRTQGKKLQSRICQFHALVAPIYLPLNHQPVVGGRFTEPQFFWCISIQTTLSIESPCFIPAHMRLEGASRLQAPNPKKTFKIRMENTTSIPSLEMIPELLALCSDVHIRFI